MKKFLFLFLSLLFLAPSLAAANDPNRPRDLATYVTRPAQVTILANGHRLFDFGDLAVGWPEFDLSAAGELEVLVGEILSTSGSVMTNLAYGWGATPFCRERGNRSYGASVKGYGFVTNAAAGTVRLDMSAIVRPRRWLVTTPARFPTCMPFRYVEVVRSPAPLAVGDLRRVDLRYPFDMAEEFFDCSDRDLVRVHDLCKRTLWIDSFLGIWVDGDRERGPYTADLANTMLSAAALSSDYAVSRRTFRWFENPGAYVRHAINWPIEWGQTYVWCAWLDWWMTGDLSAVAEKWPLIERTVAYYTPPSRRRVSDGLLDFIGDTDRSCPRLLVDWPEHYRYDYDFDERSAAADKCNAVVNAQQYRVYRELAEMATALGHREAAASNAVAAAQQRDAFNRVFLDADCGLYRDEATSSHHSTQANAAALAAGLVPPHALDTVADFLATNGMRCSVYFSQYLLDALFAAGRANAAISYMTAAGTNSWLRMMDRWGMTTVCETWDFEGHGNLPSADMPDSTHAWGTAPLNVISRHLLGVQPTEPGWGKARVRPQFGSLVWVRGVVPTAKGGVTVSFTNRVLTVSLPSAMVSASVEFAGQVRTVRGGESVSISADR